MNKFVGVGELHKVDKKSKYEDPDPVGYVDFSDPDPTCNNGFLRLFLSWKKYEPESTNSSIKWWFIMSNFMPTYLKYKYIVFFISI